MVRNYYILNHLETAFVKERCTYLERVKGEWVKKEGMVVIPVDSPGGDQDPYVFYNPWLFGYNNISFLQGERGEDSGVVSGKYHKNQEDSKRQFLLDSIFITKSRFYWVDDKREHSEIKFMFTSKTLKQIESSSYKLDISQYEDYFSCIPLYKDSDGIYKLVDILPCILKHNPEQFKGFDKDIKKLYAIENSMIKDIFNYALEIANILVITTEGKGSPKELDMELQNTYDKAIYK